MQTRSRSGYVRWNDDLAGWSLKPFAPLTVYYVKSKTDDMVPIRRSVLTSRVVTIGVWQQTLFTGAEFEPMTKSNMNGSTVIATDLYVTLLYILKYASYKGFNGLSMSCGVNPDPVQRLGPSAPIEYYAEGPIIPLLYIGIM